MSGERHPTMEYNVTAELMREFEKLTSAVAAARSESAEQTGRVLGAVASIETVQRTQATEILALHEGVKKAREMALDAKSAADGFRASASEESKAAMRAYGELQKTTTVLAKEVAEVRDETAAQTPQLALLIAANDAREKADEDQARHRRWQREQAEALEQEKAAKEAKALKRRTTISAWLTIFGALCALVASIYYAARFLSSMIH